MADNPSIPCPTDLAEKDWPIYRAALACKANVLLTGDHRDFGFLMHAPELAISLALGIMRSSGTAPWPFASVGAICRICSRSPYDRLSPW